MKHWTEKYLEELKQKKLIKDFKPIAGPAKKVKKSGMSPQKDQLRRDILQWSERTGNLVIEEHRFHDKRKWRFDFAWPDIELAVEYEGLISRKSRHTTIKGFSGDTDKYRAAALAGWTVLRYTAVNHKEVAADLDNYLKFRENEKKIE